MPPKKKAPDAGEPEDELPPPPWQRVPRRQTRRRRDPLTSEMIVAAALRILDAEGLDGLNMRRVGEELNTGAASLYWHVGSKDGLLDLLFDEVIGEQDVPDPDPKRWQEQLKEVARTMREAILRHRDIVRISIGRIPMGPNALRYSDRVLAILRAGGVPDDLAVMGHRLLIATVNGFTLDETGHREPTDGTGLPSQAAAASASRDYLASLPPSRFPNLVELAGTMTAQDRDQEFEVLIDLYVNGLAELTKKPRKRSKRAPTKRRR